METENRKLASRYTVTPTENGFHVTGVDREPAKVTFAKNWTWVVQNEEGWWSVDVGLYNLPELLRQISVVLMRNWRPKEYGNFDVRKWATGKTQRALAGRVSVQWHRFLDVLPPEQAAFHRAIYAATGGDVRRQPDEVYAHPYLVDDVLRYRAAAAAFYSISNREFLRHIEAPGDPYDLRWLEHYAPNGKPYRALNVTLSNLPGNIRSHLLGAFRRRKLARPITNRLELLTWLLYVHANRKRNGHVFDYATNADIKRAVQLVAAHQHRKLSHRRKKDLEAFIYFVLDYPHEHTGNIVGLTQKAIDWHREQERTAIEHMNARFADATPLVAPPIPFPEDTSIRFLSTAGEAHQEGAEMGHCIGGYAAYAAQGHCYLFHVDYKGERASVEVSPDGKVRQAYGEQNTVNEAARYGRRVLTRWGQGLKNSHPPLPVEELSDPEDLLDFAF